MSTIEDVRKAEKKVQQIVDTLRNAGALDPNNLSGQLQTATEEYARSVRELETIRYADTEFGPAS